MTVEPPGTPKQRAISKAHAPVVLGRPVKATRIPEGDRTELAGGTTVLLTQALGGSYTVQLEDGRKFRIEGADGDAIGQDVLAGPPPEDATPLSADEAEKVGWDRLKAVHDPEIPIDVVELGLIYTLKMHTRGDGKLLAVVEMSLTAPGCGMGDVLLADVERQLKTIPGVAAVDAKVTFNPVWNPDMMSDAAKLQLGLL